MVKIISKEYFLENQDFFKNEFSKNKIFIIPTCTIYGICAIINKENQKKIDKIKQRKTNKFYGVIVPNKKFCYKYFEKNDLLEKYLYKLPKEKLTLILKLKKKFFQNKKIFSNFKSCYENEKIGIRIVDNFFQGFLEKKLKLPIFATSVNISGEKSVVDIRKIPEEIFKKVDYIIDNGILKNKATKVVDLTNKKIKILRK